MHMERQEATAQRIEDCHEQPAGIAARLSKLDDIGIQSLSSKNQEAEQV
jgi:hypothetical protein